ncbi:DUF2169 domain-containing protein [Herbaspirillum robiniae]|uniref:DUF2169 family type VI secretion system accessory protein n=1 Tax=Herbaspirillum robiniae TaxID=2014887 RepID=UPI003D78A912
MKIFRSDELAILYRSFRFARRDTLAIGMLGLFRFDRSELAGLRPEPELWEAVAQAMGDAVLDEGYPKPCAEFKVYGNAHAPGGKPLREMMVSARLGGVARQLLVHGDRHFNAMGLIAEAQPFMHMPLTPSQAFGGQGVAANPLGKGACVVAQADGQEQWPLPNVETMGQRIINRGDVAEPAGFWGFDGAAPMRRDCLGSFNDGWMKHTWPHLPEDTRPEYFLTAAPEQRIAGYLNGDEAFELRGMHAQRATLEGRLPGLRARCFVNRRQANGGTRLAEAEARLDTVWLFPELECGIVLYRAQSDVADEDASDVMHVMAEWEDLKASPQSFAHYEALFRQRLEADAGTAVVADAPATEPAASPLTMAPVAAPAVTAVVAVPAMTPTMAEAYRLAEQLERDTTELMRRNGLSEADVAHFLAPEPAVPSVSLAEAEKMADELAEQTRVLMEKNQLSDADVMKFMQQPEETSASLPEVKGMIRDLEQQTKDLLQKNGMTEQDVEKFIASRPELAETLQNLNETKPGDIPLSAIPDAFPELPVAAEPAALAMALPAVAGGGMPQLTREQVVQRHAARESLSGYDLSGVDLSKLDLSGADFSGSLLEGTVLAGSRLADANLSGCLMQGADCSEADFTNANLAQASAGGSKFAKARLPSAQLTDADFTGADFSEAQLQKAMLDGASFEQAAMAKAQAGGASARQGNFSGADLSGADFGQAMLAQAMFNESKLAAANFKAARCEQTEFYGADASGAQFAAAALDASRADASSRFAQAVFDGAQLPRAAWDGAQLAGASFAGARLDDADFSNVQAPGASFRQASARHAKFGKADLSRADLTGANLFKGSLRKTRVEDAVLHFANAYGVDFEGVTIRAAALEGAETGQTILAFRPPLA